MAWSSPLLLAPGPCLEHFIICTNSLHLVHVALHWIICTNSLHIFVTFYHVQKFLAPDPCGVVICTNLAPPMESMFVTFYHISQIHRQNMPGSVTKAHPTEMVLLDFKSKYLFKEFRFRDSLTWRVYCAGLMFCCRSTWQLTSLYLCASVTTDWCDHNDGETCSVRLESLEASLRYWSTFVKCNLIICTTVQEWLTKSSNNGILKD